MRGARPARTRPARSSPPGRSSIMHRGTSSGAAGWSWSAPGSRAPRSRPRSPGPWPASPRGAPRPRRGHPSARRRRVRFLLLPADTFDPTPEAVARFASGSRSRDCSAGLLDAPASAVRVELDTDTAGPALHASSCPRTRAVRCAPRRRLRRRRAARDRRQTTDDAPRRARHLEVARAELVLSRPSAEPLHAAGLDPDPLAGLRARARRRCDPPATRGRCASTCCRSRRPSVGGCGGGCFVALAAASTSTSTRDALRRPARTRRVAVAAARRRAELVERRAGQQRAHVQARLARAAVRDPGPAARQLTGARPCEAQLTGLLGGLRRVRRREPLPRLRACGSPAAPSSARTCRGGGAASTGVSRTGLFRPARRRVVTATRDRRAA